MNFYFKKKDTNLGSSHFGGLLYPILLIITSLSWGYDYIQEAIYFYQSSCSEISGFAPIGTSAQVLYHSANWNLSTHYTCWVRNNVFPVGELLILSGLALRMLAGFLVVRILRTQFSTPRPDIAVVMAAVFMLSPYPHFHGMVLNGIWGGLTLIPAFISAIFTLIAVINYNVIRNIQYLYLVTSIILSIIMHPLYGLTGCVTSFLFIRIRDCISDVAFKYSSKRLIVDLVSLLTILGTLLYVKSLAVAEPTQLQDTTRYINRILSLEPDDVSIIKGFLINGAGLPALLVACMIIGKDRASRATVLTALFLIASLMILEVLVFTGLISGNYGAYFANMQWRRGIWIVFLLSLPALMSIVRDYQETMPQLKWVIMAFLLVPSHITGALFALEISKTMHRGIGNSMKFGTMCVLIFGTFPFSIKVELVGLFLLVPYMLMLYRKGGLVVNFPISPVWGPLGPVLCLLCLLRLVAGSAPWSLEYEAVLNRYDSTALVQSDTRLRKNVLSFDGLKDCVSEGQLEGSRVLFPPNRISYLDSVLYDISTEVSRFQWSSALFSSDEYIRLRRSIYLAYGIRIDDDQALQLDKGSLRDMLTSVHNTLTPDRLTSISEGLGVSLYLTERTRSDLSLVCHGKNWHLYSIN